MIANYTRSSEPVRRSGDWVLYILLLVAVMCLPGSIKVAGWVPEADRLIYTAFWASLVGVVLARTRLAAWLSGLLGTVLGKDEAAISALFASGVVAEEPTGEVH